MASSLQILLLLTAAQCLVVSSQPYQPNWESLDSRPLPDWYDKSKIGIFLHWGVFSVPSYGSEWFWNFWQIQRKQPFINFMNSNFKPNFTYQDFAKDFTAEFYDPNQWADIFNASGARYIVLTSKHHEGYTLWPSKYSFSWNAMDVGPKRDLLGELATAVRKHPNLTFGLYHSLYEWFNPLYQQDKANSFKTQDFIRTKTLPELYELVKRYKPSVIWSDGEGEAPDTYWNSTNFLAWLYNKSPIRDIVVTNDRWGSNTACKHGGFYTCQDRYNPGKLQNHKWENAMTIDKSSWGYRREATLTDILTIEELIEQLTGTVSCGGNLLINVGPTKDGRIMPIYEERLRQLGQWLAVNGEAIYESTPWLYQNDTLTPRIWYTTRDSYVYAMLLDWPKGNEVHLGALSSLDYPYLDFRYFNSAEIEMLGVAGSLPYYQGPVGETVVRLPPLTPDILPCRWAWVLKISGLSRRFASAESELKREM